jgi:hypothetical protein
VPAKTDRYVLEQLAIAKRTLMQRFFLFLSFSEVADEALKPHSISQ